MMESIPVLVFVVFLVLKLTKKINWSWWWVTSPLWVGAIISLGMLGLFLITFGLM